MYEKNLSIYALLAGERGRPGMDGNMGPQGLTGRRGEPGPAGENGRDGAPGQ